MHPKLKETLDTAKLEGLDIWTVNTQHEALCDQIDPAWFEEEPRIPQDGLVDVGNYDWLKWVPPEDTVYLLPKHMHEGLAEYIFNGRVPGDFLCALIENNFGAAICRADEMNYAALRNWVQVRRDFPCGANIIYEWAMVRGLSCIGRSVVIPGGMPGIIAAITDVYDSQIQFHIALVSGKTVNTTVNNMTPTGWSFQAL